MRLIQEGQWRRCKGRNEQDVAAFIYWAEHYAYIKHPSRGSILISLRPAQREIMQDWMTESHSIVLKARQIGWSTLAALYALWLAFFWPDRSIIMLSRNEREAVKLLKKSTYAYLKLPQWMKDRGPERLDNNVKKVSFKNDSVIESLPSKEDPARGDAASLIFVDEWAFFDNPEDAWAAIEPVADVGGRIIGLSTAKGWGNFFHTMWVGATTGVNDFKPMFYPWSANTDRDEHWYESRKEKLPGWQLAQEYPSNPEEAFIKSGSPVFDTDALRVHPTEPPLMRGTLNHYKRGIKSCDLVEHENGALRIWIPPEKDDAYVIGADVAEGLEHGDFSVADVLSTKRNKLVASWHGHIDADLFGEEIAKLGYYYNTAFVGVEVNNHGLTTNKALQRLGYPHLYVRHELDSDTGAENRQQKVGWYTSRVSKPLLIDNLAESIRTGMAIPDEHTIAELLTYVRNAKGGMEGSPFDDRVMALAIANQMIPYVKKTVEQQEADRYWTMDWFKDLLAATPDDARPPIGAFNRRS